MDNYAMLDCMFQEALLQASQGKGNARHADGQPFEEQPIMWIEKHFKSFQLGQAVKKIHESQRLEPDRARAELFGAMVFLAAKCIDLLPEVEE